MFNTDNEKCFFLCFEGWLDHAIEVNKNYYISRRQSSTKRINSNLNFKRNKRNYYLRTVANGDFGDLLSSSSEHFSSASKLPFSASSRLLRSSLRTRFVNSSESTIPFVNWHSMVFSLIALFVSVGRLISHISVRGSMFILDTIFPGSSQHVTFLLLFLLLLQVWNFIYFCAYSFDQWNLLGCSLFFSNKPTQTNKLNL